MSSFESVRPAAVAGMFYPDDPSELKRQIDFYIRNLEEKPLAGELKGIVAPHAGYKYSGQVAAAAYKQLLQVDAKTVVVIAPSHREYFKGISVLAAKAYETPLGEVPINRDLCYRLAELEESVQISWAGHREEHALEVQLPFLKRVLGEFDLIPVVMGDQTYDDGVNLGEALASLIRHEEAIIVASSDLSHYYPANEAEQMDRRVIRRIEQYDYDGFWDEIEARYAEACGAGPILACMVACRKLGANKAEILLYQHSGHVTGDYSAVVGYLSAAFYQI